MAESGTGALGPLEAEVMGVLWRAQQALSVREVAGRLNADRSAPLAYTTVMTVLDRMTAKGVVTRRKSGRAWLYSAEFDRESARLEAVGRLLANLFDDDRAALVEYLSRKRAVRLPVAEPHAKPRVARPAARAAAASSRRAAAKTQPSFVPGFMDESLL